MIYDVLIPAYNEAGSIHRIETELIPELKKNSIDFEILIVNDGSSDSTGEISDEIASRRRDVRVIHHSVNQGLGAALRTGYKNAKHPWVISIDCDLSYSPDQIMNLLEKVQSDVDVIIGSPYMKNGDVVGVSQVRIIPSKSISILYSIIVGKWLTCWTGMFRVMKTSAIRSIEITQDGFDGVAEIAVKLARKRFKIVEVPAVLGLRTEGESKASFMREFTKHLKQLIKVLLRRI
ncbi:MAG: glycosyltransferase family 2 protein [Candidatus Thorarchaeota archaeon]